MSYREDQFKRKFDTAAKELDVKSNQVMSLKLRENVNTSEYHKLLTLLESEMGIRYEDVIGDLQGTGYLISDHKTNLIIVEHETGLEILFTIGSIASIIDLMPRIIQAWRFIRNHVRQKQNAYLFDHHPPEIELRSFDNKGILREEHIPNFEVNSFMSMGISSKTIGRLLEYQMNDIFSKIQSLTDRVDKLEKIKKSRTTTKRVLKNKSNISKTKALKSNKS